MRTGAEKRSAAGIPHACRSQPLRLGAHVQGPQVCVKSRERERKYPTALGVVHVRMEAEKNNYVRMLFAGFCCCWWCCCFLQIEKTRNLPISLPSTLICPWRLQNNAPLAQSTAVSLFCHTSLVEPVCWCSCWRVSRTEGTAPAVDDVAFCPNKTGEADLLGRGYERVEPMLKAVGLGKVRVPPDKNGKVLLVYVRPTIFEAGGQWSLKDGCLISKG